MKVRILFALIVAMVANAAQAGFLIDPYIGLGQTKTIFDIGSSDDSESDSSTVLGSRVGYSFILVSAGIDYQIMNGKDTNDEDVSSNNLSAFVGVDLPILFRFWAEYFLSSSTDADFGSVDVSFKDGYGVGIGFTGLPFVSINLELETLNYDLEFGSVEGEYSVASTILSVSMPFDF